MACEVRRTYKAGDTFPHLYISDLHFDNPHCERKRLFYDLDKAKDTGARVRMFGDVLCLMQGKYDPRGNKNSIRPEHNKGNYLDCVIQDTAEKLQPYAHLIDVMSDGNHETAILKRLETDPLQRLVETLNTMGSPVLHLPYWGFVRDVFEYEGGSGNSRNVVTFYDHGHWSGIVSKGTQAASRYLGMAADADIVYSGHTHDRNLMEMPRYRLGRSGEVTIENQLYLKGGTYKQEFDTGSGWAVERIGSLKNLGGWWVNVSPHRSGVTISPVLT